MTDKLTLEYVCTGNNGRSPMAEAIANDYVHRQGLADRVNVYSSGSGLNPMFKKEGDEDIQSQLSVIHMATANGVYQESWRRDQALSVLQQRADDPIGLMRELVHYAVRAEAIFRDQSLMEVGLVADREYHKPTRPNGIDVHHVILPMTKSNADQVREVYAGSEFRPKITLLNEYAGMSGDVPNPFCQLLPAYRQTRDHLLVAVPKTIDRALKELLKTTP